MALISGLSRLPILQIAVQKGNQLLKKFKPVLAATKSVAFSLNQHGDMWNAVALKIVYQVPRMINWNYRVLQTMNYQQLRLQH